MTRWFIQSDDARDERGPLVPSELLDLVRRGEVTRRSLVRTDDSAWIPAGSVGGLFEAAWRPTIEYFCPCCQAEVGEPPVRCGHCGQQVRHGIAKITEHGIVQRVR